MAAISRGDPYPPLPLIIASCALTSTKSDPLFVPFLGDSAVGSHDLFLPTLLALCVCVFPTTASSLTYWTPPGCPTLHCISEPDYLGLVQTLEVKVCNRAPLLLMPAMVTARMAHTTWANTTLTITGLLQKNMKDTNA